MGWVCSVSRKEEWTKRWEAMGGSSGKHRNKREEKARGFRPETAKELNSSRFIFHIGFFFFLFPSRFGLYYDSSLFFAFSQRNSCGMSHDPQLIRHGGVPFRCISIDFSFWYSLGRPFHTLFLNVLYQRLLHYLRAEQISFSYSLCRSGFGFGIRRALLSKKIAWFFFFPVSLYFFFLMSQIFLPGSGHLRNIHLGKFYFYFLYIPYRLEQHNEEVGWWHLLCTCEQKRQQRSSSKEEGRKKKSFESATRRFGRSSVASGTHIHAIPLLSHPRHGTFHNQMHSKHNSSQQPHGILDGGEGGGKTTYEFPTTKRFLNFILNHLFYYYFIFLILFLFLFYYKCM